MESRSEKMAALLASDIRYDWEAYQFIEEGLQRTQERLGRVLTSGAEPTQEHHISAQELCDGVKDLGAERYGPLAGQVLAQIGIKTSEDVGEIVWNLIECELLLKSNRDRKEDFSGVLDFREAFRNLEMILPDNFDEDIDRATVYDA